MAMLLQNLTLEKKELGFNQLKENFGPNEVAENIEATIKMKGKMLLGLKEYPRLNLKRAFWRWYLNTTGSGDNLFQRAANNLVLYTNISKITSFYRLLGTVRSRLLKVHPRVKRMTTMLYLYTRYFFDRTKREAFQKIRGQGKSKKINLAERIVECARLRKLSALRLWFGETKVRGSVMNEKKRLFVDCAKKLIEAADDRKRSSFRNWRKGVDEEKRVKEIQKRFLTRLLMSKAGRVADAYKQIKNLPELVDTENRKRASRFEKGLSDFVDRTLRKSFGQFKHDW